MRKLFLCLFKISKEPYNHRTIQQSFSFQKCLNQNILTFKASALIWPRSVRCGLAITDLKIKLHRATRAKHEAKKQVHRVVSQNERLFLNMLE